VHTFDMIEGIVNSLTELIARERKRI